MLDSNAGQQIGILAKRFADLDKTIKGIQGSVNELAAGMRGLRRVGSAAADEWARAATAMDRAARSAQRAASAGIGSPGGGGSGGGGGGTSRGPRSNAPLMLPSPGYLVPRSGDNYGSSGGGLIPGGGGNGGALTPRDGLTLSPGGRSPYRQTQGSPRMGIFEMAEGYGLYEMAKLAMQEELNLQVTAIDLGFKKGGPGWDQTLAKLREAAHAAVQGTKFSESVGAAAMPDLSRIFASMMPEFGQAEIVDKFNAIYPVALRGAEVAQMMGLGNISDTMPAYMEYAHMTGTYTGPELEKRLNVLRNVATSTNNSASAEERILKYSVPIGRAAGMDPDQVAMLTGFFQQQGFNGSTAGTGLSQLILALNDTGGGLGGLMKKDAHTEALKKMNLVGADGKLSVLDDKGSIDAFKMMNAIVSFAETHSHQEVLSTEHAAFGVRGERLAGILNTPEAIAKARTYLNNISNGPSAVEAQGMMGTTTMQLFEQNLARVSDIFNTMGTSVLPQLNTAFEHTATFLGGVNNVARDQPAIAQGGLLGTISAGILGIIGGAPWFLKKIGIGNGKPMTGTIVEGAQGLAKGGLVGAAASIAAGLIEEGLSKGYSAALDSIYGPGAGAKEKQMHELAQKNAEEHTWSDAFNWIFRGGENPDTLARQRLNGAPAAPGAASPPAPPNGPLQHSAYLLPEGQKVSVESIVYLDGEQIYRATQSRQARDAKKPSTGRGDVDPRMNLIYTT